MAMAVMVSGSAVIGFLAWLCAVMPDARARDKRAMTRRVVGIAALAQTRAPAVIEAAELHMDWDEIQPKKPKTNIAVGDNLSTLSVAELEARIAEFEREIERVNAELSAKRRHEQAASALFKK